MRSRVALLAAAMAAASCTQSRTPSSTAHAAASVTPREIECGENDCSWIELPGACDEFARRVHASPGPYADVRLRHPVVGGSDLSANRVTADGETYWIELYENRYDLDWGATRPVNFVVALAEWEAEVYVYDPATITSDIDLVTLELAPLTQVLFCVKPLAPPQGSLSAAATASAGYTRTWGWRVEKSSPTATVTAAVGATVDVSYAVSVVAAPVDSGWTAGGTLVVSNPSETTVRDVTIEASYAGAPVVPTCPTAFPLTVAAGASVTCTWTAAETAPVDGTFVATVSSPEVAGPAGASASAAFGAPTAEPDACVTVTDSLVGLLGTVCATAPAAAEGALVAPARFAYTHAAGPYPTCDATNTAYSVTNTATFTAPSGASGSSTFVVGVRVPCTQAGCTLTQGYWKTHSREGPAPYDSRWRNVGPDEEDTQFFASGQTWIQVFRTPVRGSAYYALAHQYMAAWLNVAAGASGDAVASALAAARAFFAANTPATRLTAAQRAEVLALAELLDRYNGGQIGPGHCGDAEAAGGCRGDDDGDRPADRCHDGHDCGAHEACRKHDSEDHAHGRCGDRRQHDGCRRHDADDHHRAEGCGKR